ncbi:MAG: hypothetical protein HY881_14605 [Deltaproteobacteria bacterium]|nr:hypothetical protein [Deltaproteobacteria bacterium]
MRFRFMSGVIMIVSTMIPLVFMMMIDGHAAGMVVAVIMLMAMDVLVTVLHVPMRMLVGMHMRVIVGMHMRVIVIMRMIVFVFSFHHQSSCTAVCYSLSNDSM